MTGGLGCGGYGHDDPLRFAALNRFDGGDHARTGGEAVVGKDHRPARHIQWPATGTVDRFTAPQFRRFVTRYLPHRVGGQPQCPHEVVVQDDAPTGGQGPDREFGMIRGAQLAHDDRIHRCL